MSSSRRASSHVNTSNQLTILPSSRLVRFLTFSSSGTHSRILFGSPHLRWSDRYDSHSSAKVGKAAAGTADSEYRKVLDNLIADLLSTLHLPEWPGSELFLYVICQYMVSSAYKDRNSCRIETDYLSFRMLADCSPRRLQDID